VILLIKTSNHELSKPQKEDLIIETLQHISENMDKIDELLDAKATVLNTFLIPKKIYPLGFKVWNINPIVGGNAGWINVRDGMFAPTWQKQTTYNIGDLIISEDKNGHIYSCVETGVSAPLSPTMNTATDSLTYDLQGASAWIPNHVYDVNDIVISTDGNKLYYYRCTKDGLTDFNEPKWALASGMIVQDGTVTWQSYKTVQWKEVGTSCEFREFGQIL